MKKWNEVSATNLKMGAGPEAGMWDTWGIYYCSNRFGRHPQFNASYFSLAAVFIMGQGSAMDLVGLMLNHGGIAFIPLLFLVYISIGYPVYLLETIMGQYSARKPIQMLRYMLPAFSGMYVLNN
jgi:hypothetical protein